MELYESSIYDIEHLREFIGNLYRSCSKLCILFNISYDDFRAILRLLLSEYTIDQNNIPTDIRHVNHIGVRYEYDHTKKHHGYLVNMFDSGEFGPEQKRKTADEAMENILNIYKTLPEDMKETVVYILSKVILFADENH
jgi:hypothetical protein